MPEIDLFGNDAGSSCEKALIVGSEAFKDPKVVGVLLPRKIVGEKAGGLQALHEPGVKVFMRDENQKFVVAFGGLGFSCAGERIHVFEEHRAGAVLETSVEAGLKMEVEHVAGEGRPGLCRLPGVVPEADRGVEDFPEVLGNPLGVEA